MRIGDPSPRKDASMDTDAPTTIFIEEVKEVEQRVGHASLHFA
jgi:hypothetical protein